MDKERIKEDNTEKVSEVESTSSGKELGARKKKLLKFICYIIILVFSLFGRNLSIITEFDLGDFGSIVPLLLQSVALMGFKWLPIFSVVGLLVTAFEEKLGDFPNAFLTIVIIVAVVSFGLILVI